MNIRSAQVTDWGRIDEIYTEGLQLSLQGEGSTHPVRLWQIVTRTLSSLLPLSIPSEMLYVLEDDDGRVTGFIQAEVLGGTDTRLPGTRRRRPDAVRVLNLSLAPELSGAGGGALIDHLCSEAVAMGVARIYVRIPEGHAVMESFKAHGFTPYARDRVFLLSDISRVGLPPEPMSGLRPATRKDALGLFALYLAATPRSVSQVEAPEFKQWKAVHEGEWLHRFSRRGNRSMVLERNNEVVAWLGVELGSPGRPHTIAATTRQDQAPEEHLQEALISDALGTLSPHGGAVWSNVRAYDTTTTRALQDAGFEALAGQDLLVREMRSRVAAAVRNPKKEKAFAPVFG
ncbi:MAG: N-acetyltransferase family protein [Candidatus Dormibacteria bacterium]